MRKILLFTLILFNSIACVSAVDSKPNVILFYVDDMGWKDVGFMGSGYFETPNIDKMASEGMIFENGYSNAPNCAPSRACLISGQYGPRHGVYTVANPDRGNAKFRKIIPSKNKTTLSKDQWTMADSFKDAGYATASMGKFHVGKNPLDYGFDINKGGDHNGGPYYGKKYFSPYKNPNLSDGPDGEYMTDRLTDEAIKFIENKKDKNFFLYLTHFAVHTPIQAKKELIAKYKNKPAHNGQNHPVYAAMIDSVDQSMQRIVAKLQELDLDKNTVIVFTSDNGAYSGVSNARPLSGVKGSMYEGGYRVPYFVRWPAKIKAGKSSVPVMGTDLFPTFLDMIGLEKPADKILDGESLMPVLSGQSKLQRKAIFWHFPAYLQQGGSRGIWRSTPFSAIRVGEFKLIEYFEDGKIELYNLKDDIAEKNNLATNQPEKAAELHKALKNWRTKTKAPVPSEKNPKFDEAALQKALKKAPYFIR